jgi:hypothetical protein
VTRPSIAIKKRLLFPHCVHLALKNVESYLGLSFVLALPGAYGNYVRVRIQTGPDLRIAIGLCGLHSLNVWRFVDIDYDVLICFELGIFA